MNRFDDETKQSFMELYDKVDADVDFAQFLKIRDTMTNAWSLLYDELNMTDNYETLPTIMIMIEMIEIPFIRVGDYREWNSPHS